MMQAHKKGKKEKKRKKMRQLRENGLRTRDERHVMKDWHQASKIKGTKKKWLTYREPKEKAKISSNQIVTRDISSHQREEEREDLLKK